jgi:hypothetical protein
MDMPGTQRIFLLQPNPLPSSPSELPAPPAAPPPVSVLTLVAVDFFLVFPAHFFFLTLDTPDFGIPYTETERGPVYK